MEHPVTQIFVLVTLLLTAGHSSGAESTESPTDSPTDSGDNDFSENLGAGSMPTKEQKLVIDIHNEVRRRVVATNMNIVGWHKGLAEMAASWAAKCKGGTDPDRKSKWKDFSRVGQNVAMLSSTPNMEGVIKNWYSEERNYQFKTNRCNGFCDDYIQLVWDETEHVGCAATLCAKIGGQKDKHFVVCNYGSGAILTHFLPYRPGTPACSQCYPHLIYCIKGLCSRTKPKALAYDSSTNRLAPFTGLTLTLVVIGCLAM